MKIEFLGEIGNEGDAYIAACRRILRWGNPDIDATVFVNPRAKGGCLEWGMTLRNAEGKVVIFIGMLQRTPESEFEFHS
jgi:hypothetical protein